MIVQARYRLERSLSRRGAMSTWLARDESRDENTGQTVVVKLLRLRALETWKQLEHFQREANILRQLDHPALPRCLDSFHSPDGLELGLVTEYIPALSLETKLQSGWQPSLTVALDFGEQMLELLAYLHNHHPPVIHRDLKPSNILIDEQNRLYLIDFGAVQQLLEPEGSSTVVGTFGYMPPEQFAGQCQPASDLYGLGATLIHLLSGTSPADMIYSGLRLRFEPYLEVPAPVRDWLATLVAPLETRCTSARAALRSLGELRTRLAKENKLVTLPSQFKRLKIERQEQGFSCREPQRFQTEISWLLLGGLGIFNLSALLLMLKITAMALVLPIGQLALTVLNLLILKQFLQSSLHISAGQLKLTRELFWLRRNSSLELGQIREVIARPALGGWKVEVQTTKKQVLFSGLSRPEAEGLKQVLLQQLLSKS